MLNQMENDVDIHFNISIFLEILDQETSVDHLSSFNDGNHCVSKEGHSEEQEKDTNCVDNSHINKLKNH